MKRIAINDALPGMALAKAVYSRDGHRLLNPGIRLTEHYIQRISEFGIPTLYISEPDAFESLDTLSIYESVKEMPDLISFNTRLEAEKAIFNVMKDIKRGQLFDLSCAQKVINEMIDQIMANQNVIAKLADIRILDDYTFAHSVNVCVLSLANGLIFNYSRAKLCELGIGALLHDIGKIIVGEEIIKKPGPLNEREFEEIKKHTLYGYNILRQHPEISALSANIARQHHEMFNGGGYPYGITGKDIHEYAQIVAIADTYDAMTADRVYKNMVLPYEAIEVIIASSGYRFDPRLVKAFLDNTAIYPQGSIVKLSDGSIASVEKINRTLPIRPTLRILFDKEGNEIPGNVEVDLMKNTTLFVHEVLHLNNQIDN